MVINQFYKGMENVLKYYETNDYSKSRIEQIKSALNHLNSLYEKHKQSFGHDYKEIISNSPYTKSVKSNMFCCLKKFDTWEKESASSLSQYGYLPVREIQSSVFQKILLEFITYQKKLGKAKSTLKFYVYANSLLLLYMESIGIFDFISIKPDDITNYISNSTHIASLAPSTKQAVFYRNRKFISWLIKRNILNDNKLYTAMEVKVHVPSKVVTILTEEQHKALLNENQPSTAVEARNQAIIKCCLMLGLRRSDVVSLKFNEIDWEKEEIHLVQQKTNVPLVLPMPPKVGLAIALYVTKFRYNSDSPYVFISGRAPYKPSFTSDILKYSSIGSEQLHSYCYHIMRRSCASQLINHGTDIVDVIVSFSQLLNLSSRNH